MRSNLQPDHSAARRIVVAGTTGSGKSTTARRLAATIDAPYIELDALHWEPDWKHAEEEVFRARVSAAIAAPAWVVDGNYSVVRDLTWGNAQAMIWLDYTMARVFYQLFRRTLRRGLRHEELWNGNRERLRDNFFSRDSLFIWALQTHWKHRRTYPEQLAARYTHLDVMRVRTPAELERTLARWTEAGEAARAGGRLSSD